MADIHVLPGVERRDLLDPLPSAEVLAKAIEAGVTDVIVVGRDRAGNLYVASAVGDADRDVGMLMRAVSHISAAVIVNDQVISTEPPPPA